MYGAGVYCLQFDRQKLVSGSRDNSIKVWDMGSGKCVRTIHGHDQSVLCLQYDLNNRLISGSSDAKIIEWVRYYSHCLCYLFDLSHGLSLES
jgi:WD40 repeat protein